MPGRPRDHLTADQARRIALAAQGLARPGPTRATPAALRATLSRLGAIQIDAINIVARSHELVLAARLAPAAYADGPVAVAAAFDRLVYRRRAGFEYWGHAASFLPIELWRLFQPRMRRLATWLDEVRERHPDVLAHVLDRLRAEGPLPASAFREPGGPRRGEWWDWTPAKRVLEALFASGEVMVCDRVRFERRYDLTERVLPAGVDTTVPTAEEAALELTLVAAGALGVGTAEDLADYFRLRADETRAALAEAVAAGLLVRVTVDGWPRPAYVPAGVTVPRTVRHEPVLLTPFDSLIWHRDRTRRLFGFDYRLEIYVPAARRRHGYYTMPVLADGRLVARVDPRLDRAAGRLVIRAVHLEPGVDPDEAMVATEAACRRLATQLGASDLDLPAPGAPTAGPVPAAPAP